MRKVQEFFDRIGNNKTTYAALRAQLQVPPQHENAEPPISPESIKSWLVTHNAFKQGNAVDPLLQTLKRCNRTHNTPNDRIRILQCFEKPCARLLQSLDTDYLHKTLPLSPQADSQFELTISLCREMAYGYKIALHEDISSGACLDKNSTAKTIGLALEHLGRLAIRHSMIYRPWPLDFWQDANALARMALHHRSVNLQSSAGNNLNSLDKYAQLAVFQILAKNSFSTSELQGLFKTLSDLTTSITFHKKPTGTGYVHFCTGSKNPPSLSLFSRYNKKDSPLYFSVEPILAKFNDLQQANENDPSHCINLKIPSNRNRRTTSRAPRHSAIKAVTGLTEIGLLIKAVPPMAKTQLPNPHALATPPALQTKENAVLQQDSSKFGTKFIVDNQSSDGFCLRWDGTGEPCKLQIGQLIAHCYGKHSNDINWHIGKICWVGTGRRDKALKFGVKTISEHTSAAQVFRFSKREEPTGPSFHALYASHLPDDNKAPLLVLPAHTFLNGEIIGLRDQHGMKRVKLMESVTCNDHFQSFAIVSLQRSVSLDIGSSESIHTSPEKMAAGV